MKYKLITIYLLSLALAFIVGQRFSIKKPQNKDITQAKLLDSSEDDLVYATFIGETIYGRDVIPRISNDLIQLEKSKYELKKSAVINLIREKYKFNEIKLDNWKEIKLTKEEISHFAKERNINLETLPKAELESILNNIKMAKTIEKKQAKEKDILDELKIEWSIPTIK